MAKLKKIVSAILMLGTSLCLSAQQRYSIELLNTTSSQSHYNVRGIFQDSFGLTWMISNRGLSIFDGYKIKDLDLYKYSLHSQNDMLWDIKEDSLRNIWIASSEHLILYNRKDETLKKFACNISKDMPINRKTIDIAHNHIYVLGGKQLLRYNFDYSVGQLIKDNAFDVMMETQANTLYIDSSGLIWVGRADGVYVVTPSKSLKQVSSTHCMSITEHKGKIYFGGRTGVYASERSTILSNIEYSPKKILDNNIRKIFIDRSGILWLATYRGVYFCDIDNNGTAQLIPQTEHNNIYAITQDYSGTILASTTSKGTMMIRPVNNQFNIVGLRDKTGYANSKIRGIFEDKSNNLWVGTQEDGVRIIPAGTTLDKIRDSNQHYVELNSQYENTGYQFTENPITKSVYTGTGYPNWLIEFSGYNGSVKSLNKRVIPNVNSAVITIIMDEESLWAGTFFKGLLRIDRNGDVTQINPAIFETIPINCIYLDNSANIWVATNRGLFLIPKGQKNRDNPIPVEVNQLPGFPEDLKTKDVMTIFQSKDGDLWFGSSGAGLFRARQGINNTTWQFVQYTKDDGLSSNYIMAMLEDENFNLWISTNNGITRLNTRTNQARYFEVSDNLEDNQFGELSSCRRSDGMMLFGGRNGISAFYPHQITADSIAPKVQITSLSIFNKPIGVGQKLNGNIVLKENLLLQPDIILNYNQNSISFEFTSTHTAAPLRDRYRYILKNFDKEWNSSTAENRVASYTNLPPGRYTFVVNAGNNNGLWSKSPAMINIRIYPPIWARWYAYVMYTLIIAAVLYLFRRYIIKEQRRKMELILARQEKEQTQQLSISKQQFFANISHELRTPLTLIVSPLDRLLKDESKPLDTEVHKTLHLINKSAKSLMRLNNIFLDLLRKEYDFKPNIKIGDIELFTTDICQRFSEWSGEQKIELKTSFSVNNQYVWFDSELLEQILFNIISNAIKNTPANGIITVEIVQTDSEYVLSVSDTGQGIPDLMKPHVFTRRMLENHKSLNSDNLGAGIGLALTKNLVELLGWQIEFDSKEGHGTTFYIYIPIEERTDLELQSSRSIVEHTLNRIDAPVCNIKYNEISLLVVEDHVEMCDFIADSFQKYYNVYKAHDGQQALDILEQASVNIIISDIMMPCMNGLELCQFVKGNIHWSHIPVILLTAQSIDQTQIESYNAKADAYCQKPFEIDILLAMVQSLLANRQALYDKFKGPIVINPSEVTFNSPDAEFLGRLIAIVEDNISDSNFTVTQLAEMVAMTQQRLNNKLSGLTNMKANAFIRNIRLKRAAQLLVKSSLNITETMYEVGFEDSKYFRNCFKEDFGMSPSEYQRSHTEV